MLTLAIHSIILTQTPEATLGSLGESCRARADCQAGLKCLNSTCTAPLEASKLGHACEATGDCSADGSLRCVANVCKSKSASSSAAADPIPATPPLPVMPPPSTPPSVAQDAFASTDTSDSTHFFLGLEANGGAYGLAGMLGPNFRFGWFFRKTQLSFELGAVVLPSLGVMLLSGRSSLGFAVPIVESSDSAFFWSPKAGLSAFLGGLSSLGVHLDLISFGLRTGRWLIELQLPSVALHAIVGAGIGMPIQGRLTAAFVF